MKLNELNELGVQELTSKEMEETKGGIWLVLLAFAIGFGWAWASQD